MPRIYSFKPAITLRGRKFRGVLGGAVLSLAAAVTGFWDWWKGIDRDRSTGWLGRAKHTQVWRTINTHATIMVTATVLVLIEIVVRLSQYGDGFTGLFVMILSVIVALLVTWG